MGGLCGWAGLARPAVAPAVLVLGLWMCLLLLPDLPPRSLHLPPVPELVSFRMLSQDEATARKRNFPVLIDIDNFHWLMGDDAPPECSWERPLPESVGARGGDGDAVLLVLVTTAPHHPQRRAFIRRTWGSGRGSGGLVLRFMLGAVATPAQQALLEREEAAHGDLVQGSFLDSYANMTYKHVAALKWASYLCPRAIYIFKVDDDVIINVDAALELALGGGRLGLGRRGAVDGSGSGVDLTRGAQGLILCRTAGEGHFSKRNFRTKWRMPYRAYRGHWYPNHCFGLAVWYSPDMAARLYLEAQRGPRPPMWIDDLYITGFLARKLHVRLTPWEAVGAAALNDVQAVRHMLDEGALAFTPYKYIVGPHLDPYEPELSERLWNLTQQSRHQPFYRASQPPSTAARR